ncbi:calcium/sodium antiporter [[Mycobacterium] burgundiense]|jgi:cation:H+ antiporter|uniref:Calcium/sodium antiporter n=1 Tax=[Mycobacterium] burgundiense TaxID=3064286 RepID=A0ABM9LP94_9MYCO|nr:calcium/sodium antiporter [Mycolicibacterium sp. MU0053]CAJ1502429.1 calcium/sodium antiporter [Mycolicibacterium sp. MU0053]
MTSDLAWFAIGLIALVAGSDWLVKGGTRLASQLGISPILIGLTVVSIGTSMPELAVGLRAAASGNGSLAVGNIAGTNIVNLLLILGLSALLRPLVFQLRTLKLDLPMMTAAAVLLWLLASDGTLSMSDGAVLTVCAIFYTAVLIYSARRENQSVQDEFAEEYAGPVAGAPVRRTLLRDVTLLLVGIVVVVIGADWLVRGAVGVAQDFGVSDAFIGLTVVAIGTSAPELATTLVATFRGERDIAIGNLLGSSVYNILLILGVTVLGAGRALQLDPTLVRIDIPVMALVALVCIPIFLTGRRVSRLEGGAMVAAYLGYLAFLVVGQM